MENFLLVTEVRGNLLVISRQLNFLLLIVFEEVMLFFFALAFAPFFFLHCLQNLVFI